MQGNGHKKDDYEDSLSDYIDENFECLEMDEQITGDTFNINYFECNEMNIKKVSSKAQRRRS